MLFNKHIVSIIIPAMVGLALLCVICCQGHVYTPEEYTTYIENNSKGHTVIRDFEQMQFRMTYQPPAYLAAKQIQGHAENEDSFFEILDEYKQSSHYIMRLENKEGRPVVRGMVDDVVAYQELIQYLAFSIKDDVRLYSKSDTIPCQFAHFERNYDLAPFAQIQLGFALPDESVLALDQSEEWTVEFDAYRLGLGPIKFRFQNNRDINNPNIIF